MRFWKRLFPLGAAAAIALVVSWTAASPASAVPLTSATLDWASDTANGSIDLLNPTPPPGLVVSCSDNGKSGNCSLSSSFTPAHGLFRLNSWTSQYDTDPFVTNNFNVTNLSLGTLIYDFTVTSPVVVTGPQTAMSGSLGITLTNTTGTAVLTSAGLPVYQALIDGLVERTLFPPVYTLTCTPPFCSITDSDDFGIPVPEIGPQADVDIAIRIRFALSPGDSAGVTSVFNIEAVPEPATGALLGLGLLGLVVAGRRR